MYMRREELIHLMHRIAESCPVEPVPFLRAVAEEEAVLKREGIEILDAVDLDGFFKKTFLWLVEREYAFSPRRIIENIYTDAEHLTKRKASKEGGL